MELIKGGGNPFQDKVEGLFSNDMPPATECEWPRLMNFSQVAKKQRVTGNLAAYWINRVNLTIHK